VSQSNGPIVPLGEVPRDPEVPSQETNKDGFKAQESADKVDSVCVDRKRQARQLTQSLFDNLLLFLSVCLCFLSIVGTVMVAILNRHSYLLIGQRSCYASYVGSRFGYVDLYGSEVVETAIKAMTWVGVHM
jgi:hypothetical protein